MLSTKQRLIVLLLLLMIGLIPVSAIVLARVLNLDTNVHDPLYFDSVTSSTFEYNNGTHVIPLTFNSVLNGTSYQTEVSYGGNDFMFNVTPDGGSSIIYSKRIIIPFSGCILLSLALAEVKLVSRLVETSAFGITSVSSVL